MRDAWSGAEARSSSWHYPGILRRGYRGDFLLVNLMKGREGWSSPPRAAPDLSRPRRACSVYGKRRKPRTFAWRTHDGPLGSERAWKRGRRSSSPRRRGSPGARVNSERSRSASPLPFAPAPRAPSDGPTQTRAPHAPTRNRGHLPRRAPPPPPRDPVPAEYPRRGRGRVATLERTMPACQRRGNDQKRSSSSARAPRTSRRRGDVSGGRRSPRRSSPPRAASARAAAPGA